MRGKAPYANEIVTNVRITPAHAGKRPISSIGLYSLRDHPRTCGEKSLYQNLVRNTLGITPAHAGKSAEYIDNTKHTEDHPRTCGEKSAKSMFFLSEEGSPPHMRGKERCLNSVQMPLRITPAHAGKRSKSEKRTLFR